MTRFDEFYQAASEGISRFARHWERLKPVRTALIHPQARSTRMTEIWIGANIRLQKPDQDREWLLMSSMMHARGSSFRLKKRWSKA